MGNAESSVERHVEQARKTGVCSLKDTKLSQVRQTRYVAVHVISRDSTQVPQAVLDLKGTLRTLDVSVNRLTSLPPSLADFSLLRTLNISHNRLS